MNTTYLDNGATTKIYPEVIETITKELNNYGNPSSNHSIGYSAKVSLTQSRQIIANELKAKLEEIVFTSGGTESNNFAIKGMAFANKDRGNHIITTKIEHDCILNACKWLETQGFTVTYLDVDEHGFIDLNQLEKEINPKTILISIIHANNEIGTIQNIKKIYEICKAKKVPLHTDACQSFTKEPINSDMADLITLNAHKINGPKGVGALYIKRNFHGKITPLIHGGGHEFNLRSGTENTPLIAGFAKAVELKLTAEEKERIKNLRDQLIEGLLKIPESILNGPIGDKRLINNVNVSFKRIEGESIVALLNQFGICASTGSACSSNTLDASHVMLAIENSHERAHSSTRFSLSKETTKEDINYTIEKVKEVVKTLRDISPM